MDLHADGISETPGTARELQLLGALLEHICPEAWEKVFNYSQVAIMHSGTEHTQCGQSQLR